MNFITLLLFLPYYLLRDEKDINNNTIGNCTDPYLITEFM